MEEEEEGEETSILLRGGPKNKTTCGVLAGWLIPKVCANVCHPPPPQASPGRESQQAAIVDLLVNKPSSSGIAEWGSALLAG